MQRLQLIKYTRLSEEQADFVGFYVVLQCCKRYGMKYHER